MSGNDEAIKHVARVLNDQYGQTLDWAPVAKVAVEALLDHVYTIAQAEYYQWVMSLPDAMDHRKH